MTISTTKYGQTEIYLDSTVPTQDSFDLQSFLSMIPDGKKIVLVGGFGSGKTYISNKLRESGKKICVSHTTRIKRKGEEEGVDYYFKTVDEIKNYLNYDVSIQWDKFVNGCYYVTTLEEYSSSDVIILTPRGLNKFPPILRQDMVVVYFDIDLGIRKQRYANREGFQYNMEDRIAEEQTQFGGFMNWDIRITDIPPQ